MSKYGGTHTTYRARLAEQSKQAAAEGRAKGLDTGWTMASYMISGLIAYGLIGWLLASLTHVQILLPVGMLFGIAVSTGYVIYKHGRQEQPQQGSAHERNDR
jgi:ATP synthase protein I